MRALLALLLIASPAFADELKIDASYVSGELKNTTAILRVRYTIAVPGPTFAAGGGIMHPMPPSAVMTAVTVHAPDGAHQLGLVENEPGQERFRKLANGNTGSKKWAVMIEDADHNLAVSVAAAKAATLTLDIEMQAPTCFFQDARFVELPLAWKSILSPSLRTRTGKDLELGPACRNNGSFDSEELWAMFPTPDLANKPAGVERFGANAARIDVGDAHIARLEVALAKRIAEVPRDLATAIVIDTSRSMTSGALEAQRELVKAYARAAGTTQLQIVSYARTARPLLANWTAANVARARIDRELNAIVPHNGSNIDLGLVEASRWLARTTGTKRVVLFTDQAMSRRVSASYESFAKLLPPGTLLHVVDVDEFSELERNLDSRSHALAQKTGGIAVRAGNPDPEKPLDTTMLLRPIRIDDLDITAPGWKRFNGAIETTCSHMLDEGHSCVWWGEGDTIAGPLHVDGWIWGTRLDRVVTPDPSRKLELARELSTGDIFLEDNAFTRVQKLARAANRGWSFYGEWGGSGGYEVTDLYLHGSSGRCCRGGRSARAPSVRIGHAMQLPSHDLFPHLAGVIARCNLGDTRVEVEVETTLSEIVDVQVFAAPAVVKCVEDAIWDTQLTILAAHFHASSRVVLVQ